MMMMMKGLCLWSGGIFKTNNKKPWSSEWGYKVIFGDSSSSRAGVKILFNHNLDFFLEYLSEKNGRLIMVVKTNNECFTIVNGYGPNEDL